MITFCWTVVAFTLMLFMTLFRHDWTLTKRATLLLLVCNKAAHMRKTKSKTDLLTAYCGLVSLYSLYACDRHVCLLQPLSSSDSVQFGLCHVRWSDLVTSVVVTQCFFRHETTALNCSHVYVMRYMSERSFSATFPLSELFLS